jgi:hypothetical protein
MTNFDADVHYIAGCPMLVSHQKQVSVLETSSMAVASAPPPSAEAGLMACSYNDARFSAKQVLWHLQSSKDAEADRKGNMPSFNASNYLFFY